MGKPIDPKVVPEAGVVTKEGLERYWDEVMNTHGPTRTIGVNLTAPFGDTQNPGIASLMVFLPQYIVATFLKCQECSSCCRPNIRKWDKGVILSRDEMVSLRQYCPITKRNGQYLLKYPCPLLKDNRCRQYPLRPLGCRLFPFNISIDKATSQSRHGIIMTCPAGKELYITSQLFLQELAFYLQECRRLGKQRFNIQDLEMIKLKFNYNQVSAEDTAYMKKMAMNPYHRF